MYQKQQAQQQQRRASDMNQNQTPPAEQLVQHVAPELQGRKKEYVEGNLKIQTVMEFPSEVMCVEFSADGGVLAVGLSEGVIKVCNPDTGQVLYSVSDEESVCSRLPVTAVRFKPPQDGEKPEKRKTLMATYASGIVKFWHYPSSSCVHTIHENRQTLAAAYNPMGGRFITGGANAIIELYDDESKTAIRTMQPSDMKDVMNGHRARIFALSYHPMQPTLFISGGWDDTVQFWDERQPHAFRKIFGPHICGDSLDIDPYHSHILSGSWRKDKVLQIWDFGTGKLIKDVPQDPLHGSALYCAQWLGRDSIACGGCSQNMARVLDRGTLNTVGQLVELPGGVYCMDNDRQGLKPRMACGAGNKVYVVKSEKQTIS